MSIKKITALLTAGLLAASLVACGQQTSEDTNTGGSKGAEGNDAELTAVRVVLDWAPNTNHTGLYAARELGYYEDAGLAVEIIQPPEDGALALVAAGKAEVAVGFQESLGPALSAASPLPVTAVAAIISHNTSGLVSLSEEGIQSPKDLAGKRFASWDAPLVNAVMRKVIEADGGDMEQVEFVPNSVTDVISALQADIDVVWIYEAWDGILLSLSDLDTNYMAFAELEPIFDFYTPVLVAGDDFLEKNPETARAFMEATSRGYQYAIEHPQEAAELLCKCVPELDEELVLQSQLFLQDQYQADAPQWGYIDEARWARFYDWMYSEGLLEKDLGASGFTNDYLPAAGGEG